MAAFFCALLFIAALWVADFCLFFFTFKTHFFDVALLYRKQNVAKEIVTDYEKEKEKDSSRMNEKFCIHVSD